SSFTFSGCDTLHIRAVAPKAFAASGCAPALSRIFMDWRLPYAAAYISGVLSRGPRRFTFSRCAAKVFTAARSLFRMAEKMVLSSAAEPMAQNVTRTRQPVHTRIPITSPPRVSSECSATGVSAQCAFQPIRRYFSEASYIRWFVSRIEDPAGAVIIDVGDRPESQVFNFSAPRPERARVRCLLDACPPEHGQKLRLRARSMASATSFPSRLKTKLFGILSTMNSLCT